MLNIHEIEGSLLVMTMILLLRKSDGVEVRVDLGGKRRIIMITMFTGRNRVQKQVE